MLKEKTGPEIHEVCTEGGGAALEALSLSRVRELLVGGFGERVRETPHRCTERIRIAHGRELFLKLYDAGAGRIGKVSRGQAPAEVEWENGQELLAAGVSIPVFLCGVWTGDGDRDRSGVLIQGVEGAHPLDQILQVEGFSEERRVWMEESLLPLILGFHAKGYQHRDLYACHILVRDLDPPVLIDLARIRHQRRLSRRRRVKDLAALYYSLQSRLPEGYLESWILRYGREAGFGSNAAGLLASVQKKSARIAAHVPRYDKFPP